MKYILLVLFNAQILVALNAQTISSELISSAGDSFNNSNLSVNWSLGECFTATHAAETYVLTQGFQQGVYTITTVENLQPDIEISTYPNPTTDLIHLNLSGFENLTDLNLTITDHNGKITGIETMNTDTHLIDFSNYSAGTYFISIFQNKRTVKTFQIIKN